MIGLIPKHNWHQWWSSLNIGLPSRRRCIPLDEAGRRALFECIPRFIPIRSSQSSSRRQAVVYPELLASSIWIPAHGQRQNAGKISKQAPISYVRIVGPMS